MCDKQICSVNIKVIFFKKETTIHIVGRGGMNNHTFQPALDWKIALL